MSISHAHDPAEPYLRFLPPEALPSPRATFAAFSVMALILWLDHQWPVGGQVAASLITWAAVAVLYLRAPRPAQRLLMACLVTGMLGEIFCSLIWKLYDYRLLNIPAYVPPGHVMMFLIGSSLAPRMPKMIVWLVPALVTPYGLAGLWYGFDYYGMALFAMFVLCLIAERDARPLYATMFMLCLLLEVYGTALGNWTWKLTIPYWNMSSTNPPISAGVFYCLLDFLMLRLALGSYRFMQAWHARGTSSILLRPLFSPMQMRTREADMNVHVQTLADPDLIDAAVSPE